MESKKINQLGTNVAPSVNDLTIIGDPLTGQLKKVTWGQIATLIGSGGLASFHTDYDYDIIGARDSVNLVFTTSFIFDTGTTRVFKNGLRLTRGVGYDYVESATNQITFSVAPDDGDLLIIEYIKL